MDREARPRERFGLFVKRAVLVKKKFGNVGIIPLKI